MRVICVDKKPARFNHPALIKAWNEIKIGEQYNVVAEKKGAYNGDIMYELAEFPHPYAILWEKECFIPLSDIDETAILAERLDAELRELLVDHDLKIAAI